MPGADVAFSCLVLAHGGDPDAVLENGFADGQWREECAHVVIIKGLWKERAVKQKVPQITLRDFFAVLWIERTPMTTVSKV